MIYFNGIKGSEYFEGWFFRVSAEGLNCALIPSVAVSGGERKAYIQVNCNGETRKTEFPIEEFYADDGEVQIGGNRFSDEGIAFRDETLELNVRFGRFSAVGKDIMGCFKFGTPCKHRLISLRHTADGTARISKREIAIENGVGYLEKDWGRSFPTKYCWLQCNEFESGDASFFLSMADIGFPFRGLICVLVIGGEEYRFATYNFARIRKLQRGAIELCRRGMTLTIRFLEGDAKPLLAPSKGKMRRTIKEGLNGTIELRLEKRGKTIFKDRGKNAGIEWVDL